ncbi:unnamed protein product [Psylliodes chrysocephalus]|uniref:Uncharacterized protein n=1 Tax=Psylliodes chrysocephalus TaxID=3402493 RepID=A0A9P0GKK1_9CUCU|nr:unnamed protein product [Psylliodes chrysocephala]
MFSDNALPPCPMYMILFCL